MDNILSAIEKLKVRHVVPDQRELRDQYRDAVRRYVAQEKLIPPPSMEDLEAHANVLIETEKINPSSRDFLMVMISNEIWIQTIATIPYERRILLIPQCLRSTTDCPAEMDEFGLLCRECGQCPISELQSLAEELGYIVLVAEGTTVVLKLLERGKIDAVIGVSCLSVLEKSFPYTATHAIPAIAVPLFKDGCSDTKVDVGWVREAIMLASDNGWSARLDLDKIRDEVRSWFLPDDLEKLIGPARTRTEKIALDWMIVGGKRWRPFLVACVYQALSERDKPVPEAVRKLAVSVEYFHKASLIHDDIEDNDDLRYDKATLHLQHGMPIALNIGDLLLGDGYKLIAKCGLSPEQTSRLAAVASDAHRKLCLGQGEELFCMKGDTPPSSQTVLDIFRWKTSPAFEVALQFGAIAAGCNHEVCAVLTDFSNALGIAYQILDDLDDIRENTAGFNLSDMRSSLLFSLAFDHADDKMRQRLRILWRKAGVNNKFEDEDRKLLTESSAQDKAELLFEHYKNEAIRALNPLRSAELKTLLRRIVGKILRGI